MTLEELMAKAVSCFLPTWLHGGCQLYPILDLSCFLLFVLLELLCTVTIVSMLSHSYLCTASVTE